MNSLIKKSRYGRYEDNPENRRLHRVGAEYGHAAAQQDDSPNQPKKEENPLERDAAALERKIADIKKNKRIWLEYEDGESRFNKITTQLQTKLDGINKQLKGGGTEQKETVKETTIEEEPKQNKKESAVKEKEATTEEETKQDSEGEQEEEFTYRIKFDDMPDSGKVKFKKYLSNKIKNRIDDSFKNLQGLDDKTVQLLHDGIVKDFNENFESMKKSERAEALYKTMKIKGELEKREKAIESESLPDVVKNIKDKVDAGHVVFIENENGSKGSIVKNKTNDYEMLLNSSRGEIPFKYSSMDELLKVLTRSKYKEQE